MLPPLWWWMSIIKCTIIGGMCQAQCKYYNFRSKFAKNVRKIREEKNFTQETFAEALNSSPKYIGCIERGEKSPSFRFLFNMAEVLDTSIENLVKDTM